MTENKTVSLCLMKESDMEKSLASINYALGVIRREWKECWGEKWTIGAPYEAERLRVAYSGLRILLDSAVKDGRIIEPLDVAFPELADIYRELDKLTGKDCAE